MRFSALAVLLLAACQAAKDLPTGSLVREEHPDYAKFRPVAIGVLRFEAPRGYLRDETRQEVYQGLFQHRYSPLALDVVDAHTESTGEFKPTLLEWDATLTVSVKKWRALRGGAYFAADGSARLIHKSGEVLWQLSFQDQAFEVPSGKDGHERAARSLGKLIVSRMPPLPPPPRE